MTEIQALTAQIEKLEAELALTRQQRDRALAIAKRSLNAIQSLAVTALVEDAVHEIREAA